MSAWRSLVGHDREVDVDVGRRPASAATASVTRLVISARSGQPATVSATVTCTRVAVDRDAPHHVEVDDRAVQLGVLDGPQGFEDVGFGSASGLARSGGFPLRR